MYIIIFRESRVIAVISVLLSVISFEASLILVPFFIKIFVFINISYKIFR